MQKEDKARIDKVARQIATIARNKKSEKQISEILISIATNAMLEERLAWEQALNVKGVGVKIKAKIIDARDGKAEDETTGGQNNG